VTVGEALGKVVWYLREFSGEAEYDRYVAHRRKRHPGEPVMTPREFWRWRMDEKDRNPGARCC
jgi:uncharacterized short protein YbdD (DUF466 family)